MSKQALEEANMIATSFDPYDSFCLEKKRKSFVWMGTVRLG